MHQAAVLGKALAKAVIQRQHLAGFGLLPPGGNQCLQPLGLLRGQVVVLVEIFVQVVELPDIVVEGLATRMKGHRLPALLPQTAVAEHLDVLRPQSRRRGRVVQRGGKTLALERQCGQTLQLQRFVHADQVQQGRRQVGGMVKTMAQLTARGQTGGPADDQRVADAAAMGVLLVALERCVGAGRPAPGKVAVRVGPADVVDAGQFGRGRFGLLVVGPHGVDEAQ